MKRFLIKKVGSDSLLEVNADRYEIVNGNYQFYANESVIFTTLADNISECKLDSVNNSEYSLLKS